MRGFSFGHNRRMTDEYVTRTLPTWYSRDARPRSTGCYVSRFHDGELSNGDIACARPPDPRTMGYAARGRCYWQREPGADDE